MYTTCLFCHGDLGRNDAIERFPVGRRLAFDADKGRLWVVCVRCARWNLSPLEERWEAIEECERSFRATRLRVSTDNIGLARLAAGLELVRIGRPQRPEFAAWRYGDQFGRRRRRAMLTVGAGVVSAAALGIGGVAVGAVTATSAWSLFNLGNTLRNAYESRRLVGRIATVNGDTLLIRGRDLHTARLVTRSDLEQPQRWASRRSGEGLAPWGVRVTHDNCVHDLVGDAAVRAVALLLARINRLAGSRSEVREAVTMLETSGGPTACFVVAADAARHDGVESLRRLPTAARLALEMAAHEDSERRALEGELAQLEHAWREAEEIAAIADNLLLPPVIEQFLGRHRRA